MSPIPAFESSVPEKSSRGTTRNYHFTRIPCSNIDTLSGCTLGESICGSIAILPSSKSVSIHCSSSSTRSGRSSRSFLCSGKNRIDAGSDAALSVGCGIASTRWRGVSSILSPPSFLSFPILHSSPEDNYRDSFLDNAIYLFIYQWKLARKVL